MTDLIKKISLPERSRHLFLREEDLRQDMTLFFLAYRDFVEEANRILDTLNLGRAHHRVLFFVKQNPGLTVGDLLGYLKITKQSLSRVLKHLIQQGYITQEKGADDRRQRCLFLSPKGEQLEKKLIEAQLDLFFQTYERSGENAVNGFHQVLISLVQTASELPKKTKEIPKDLS